MNSFVYKRDDETGNETGDRTGDRIWMTVRTAAVMAGIGCGTVLLAADLVSGEIGWDSFAIGMAVLILSVAALKFPLTAAALQTLLWACINAIPASAGLPWALFVPCASTLMLASFRHAAPGFVLGAMQSVTIVVAHGILGLSGTAPAPIADMIAAFALPAAACVGIGMQWRVKLTRMHRMRRELDRQREINEERRRREAIAVTLHDQVTNRLAYQILRMQHDAQTWLDRPPQPGQYHAEISELLDISQDLLEQIRAAIDILDSETIPGSEPSRRTTKPSGLKTVPAPDPQTEQEMLKAHLQQSAEDMHELGLTVTTHLSGSLPPEYDPAVLDVIHTGIDEFTSNMVKYADRTAQCSLAVDATVTSITLTSSNMVDAESVRRVAQTMTGGRGLVQLAEKADDASGSLSRARNGKERIFRLSIPWQRYEKGDSRVAVNPQCAE